MLGFTQSRAPITNNSTSDKLMLIQSLHQVRVPFIGGNPIIDISNSLKDQVNI